MAYKGKYKPANPQKYVGDATKIVYRSLWERRCMKMFDSNKNIIKWASEEVAIPYRSPKDNRIHKYYPDFIVEQKNKRGEVEIVMIEVKPKNKPHHQRCLNLVGKPDHLLLNHFNMP